MNTKIVIDTDGQIKFIVHPELHAFAEMGNTQSYRASHIEPVNAMLRLAFHLLRNLFGEVGLISDFTRQWPVVWRVNLNLSDGPIIGRFKNRQDALDCEVQWLLDNRFN